MAKKVKVDSFPAPQTKQEANAALARIGTINSHLNLLQAARDGAVAEADVLFSEASKPFIDERDGRVMALAAYCEAHRDELTDGGKTKTAKFLAGEISWRFTPPSVSLRNVPQVIAVIRSRRLAKKFLRVRVEVSKEALLAEPDAAQTIPGVSISRREELIFKPNDGGEIVGKTVKLPAP